MSKLTLKKIAENTLRKVGRPLSTTEIWEEANRLGTVKDFVSKGKTPWATIGAYLYWSINRDKEGIFTLEGENPRRFGLVEFDQNINVSHRKHFLIGTTYYEGDGSRRNLYNSLIERNVVAIGFCWDRNLSDLYGNPSNDIRNILKKEGYQSKEYSAIKKFLQLEPGDIVAIKHKGWPKAGKACLEIVAYAMVVEREGEIYFHDPNDLGHCINVEFIETGLDIDREIGGYGETIYEITDQNRIDVIFDIYQKSQEKKVRSKIRKRRKRKGTSKKNKGKEARSGSKPYVADLKHNEIQEAFYLHLKSLFQNDRVEMEEDFIDVIRENDKEIILYEVKPFAWAEDCIREGLGQLLSYAHQVKTKKKVKLIIVGPYEPNKEELEFIEYVQSLFKLPFEYINFKN